nr:immunoglobulin light chain junction region [Macaca mulatta]MOX57053.1 immunoglobulin light chain junction region [Macaca mulatta]
CQQYDDVPYSF